MKVLGEPGVLARSERFFSTPGAVARRLFYYVTRAGHYYYDENYDFRDNCEIAHLESHRNFYLLYVRAGTMCVHTDHEFSVERGQAALVDCRKPHRFFTKGDAEAIWIHFDGANAAAFFAQIVAFNGGRQTFSPPAPLHLEQELAQLVLGLRTGEMSEVERSQALYRILCGLLLPQSTRGQRENDAVASAVRFIDSRLTEELPVRRIAAHVNLSASHFSRLFRAATGFSPHEYIMLHRIDEAKALLHSTALSVSEIAFRVGFRSEVNFITAFRSKTGQSPTQFRSNPF